MRARAAWAAIPESKAKRYTPGVRLKGISLCWIAFRLTGSYFKAIISRGQSRWLLALWAGTCAVWGAIGIYDLYISQWVKREDQEKWPKVREIIAMISEWMPWWAWGWLGTALLLLAVSEYAVRLTKSELSKDLPKRAVAILKIWRSAFGEISIENSDNIKHLEKLPDGTFQVEFNTQVDHRTLSARYVTSGTPLELMERCRSRAKFAMHPYSGVEEIIFECADI